jgi:hypothetical protein
MEWNIVTHQEEGYVEVTTRGLADGDGSLAMAKALSTTMRTHLITRALVDHRGVREVAGATIDIYERPRLLRLIGTILRIRIAELVKPEHREHFAFFETVCVNQGFQFAVFEDPDQARAWLLG